MREQSKCDRTAGSVRRQGGMDMLKQLDNYDWWEAFKYAGEPPEYPSLFDECSSPQSAFPGDEVSLARFTREDVVEIIGISEGENDGDDWVVCGRLRDGRWFSVRAWCDYTGWG